MTISKVKFLSTVAILFSIFHLPFSASSQVRPVYDYGAAGLGQLLKKLVTTKSVMMIGAHPDDEDSALLAYLARGENARTAYLSLTRGDGGQNIVGPELFESLGVIRSEELLQARRLDGAEQFFTRAFDYGFSKTLAEARQKWDEKVILCDAVGAIRRFRPLVVISRFSGTPNDGHGQHQYAGYITPLAVKAAADPAQCTDYKFPWQVSKFYVEQGFRGDSPAALKINTGEYNNLLGRSYYEIAIEGRSQHKSQGEGNLELKGDLFSGLNLADSQSAKIENEKNIFDGLDTSLGSLARSPNLPKDFPDSVIREMQKLAEEVLRAYDPEKPRRVIPGLIEFNKILKKQYDVFRCTDAPDLDTKTPACSKYTAEQKRAIDDVLIALIEKDNEYRETLQKAAGVRIDALADREIAAPGEKFSVMVRAFYPKDFTGKPGLTSLTLPAGWTTGKAELPKANPQSFRSEKSEIAENFEVTVAGPEKASLYTQPYWLEEKRRDALFSWNPNSDELALPFSRPAATATVSFEIDGEIIAFSQPIEYRFADPVRGEVRRELNIVPKISLSVDQQLLIVPQNKKAGAHKISLTLSNNAAGPVSGTARLNVPAGWQILPREAAFELKNKGEKTSVVFTVTVPANEKIGSSILTAEATAGGDRFTQTMNTIAYPHIQTHRFYTAAETKAVVLNLKTVPVKVGYIMGSGDDVPESLRQMGLTVDLLNEKDLSDGGLSKYDAVVVGIRAYQTRRDLISNNQKVMDYVKNGGTLIVQYQRPDYVANNLQPLPASMSDKQGTTAGTTARVVDENAKVTILQPASPVFNFPNQITGEDFDGWVQERDLYNFASFDDKYMPLLESHDTGEQENKGGMVYAKIGKGNYVYTSYSFFRQLPAGVPGAYRLFANLLSLSKAQNQ